MNYLISAAVGGAIGYLTNWLAIRMLFRPYEEKKLMGLSLPFTPGLIPKERERMAKNIGLTVRDYLIEPEDIMKSLKEDRISQALILEIKKQIEGLDQGDISLEDLAEKYISGHQAMVNKEIDRLLHLILAYLGQEELEDRILSHLEASLFGLKRLDFEQLILRAYQAAERDPKIRGLIDGALEEFFRGLLESEKSLGQLLPDSIKEDMAIFLRENSRLIAYKGRELIETQEIKSRIKAIIRSLVEENLSGLILNFLPMDLITEKGYQALDNYLKGEDAALDINQLLNSGLAELYKNPMAELSKNMVVDFNGARIRENLAKLLNSPKFRDDLIDGLYQAYSLMDRQGLRRELADIYRGLIESEELAKSLRGILESLKSRIYGIRIKELMDYLGLDEKSIYNILRGIFQEKVQDRLADFIDIIDLASIVEERVNSFSHEFIEKLVMEIAAKELRAITNLGALLGALIGLVNPILQSLL